MDLTARVVPAEVITAGFNVVLALAWLAGAPPGGPVPLPVGLHVLAAGLPWLLGAAGRRRLGGTLRDLYPLLSFAVFWSELGALHAAGGPTGDGVIAALDTRLFGVHLTALWMPAMPQLWLSELMHFSYVAYYIMVILTPLAFVLTGDRVALRDVVLRLVATYALCFTAYLLFPVLGPAHTMPLFRGPPTTGFFYHLSHAAHAAGDAAGTAFPSSHVAGAMAVAWTGWHWCRRSIAWLLVAETVGVALSTVYTQNHYPVDVLAGAAVALGVQLALVPRLTRPAAARAVATHSPFALTEDPRTLP